ncbi:hypothetical protein LDO32_19285 [Luteimonas sp. Y-2-2-4F]|nr:hypothetical protein [Luteimonas sp. Y-2-2-4F]
MAALLLLWNLFGLWSFWSQYSLTPERVAALPEAQRGLFEAMPAWAWIAYGVAVLAGTAGASLLLLGRRLALPIFWVSLAAVLVQFGYAFGPGRAVQALGAAAALPVPIVIVAIAIVQVWLARRASARGWIA